MRAPNALKALNALGHLRTRTLEALGQSGTQGVWHLSTQALGH